MKQGRGVNRIDTGVLIPGAGAPVAAATVLTDGGTITYAGPAAGLGPGAPARADVHVPVVMPGMWDCHCHLYGVRRFSLDDMLITPVPTAAARAAKDAEAALQAEAVTASGRARLARKRHGQASSVPDSTPTCWP